MPDTSLDLDTCPRCQATLSYRQQLRWCGACEWNLDQYDPDRHGRAFPWIALDRWAHRLAYRMNTRQFAALAEGDLRPRMTLARLVLIAVSAGLLLAVAGTFVAGAWLLIQDFPSPLMVPGIILVLIALLLRPRFGRVDPLLERLTPQQAPHLFRLIQRVAIAVGTAVPQVVGVDRNLNASVTAVGLRHRWVLHLGLPLWVALPPQQRIAVLAHELSHLTNGDVRTLFITQPALRTFGLLALTTRPSRRDIDDSDGVYLLGAYLAYLVMAVLSTGFGLVHMVLVWIGSRDGQRAEYLADDRAATVAGSSAACGMLDSLVAMDSVAVMLARAARETADVAAWSAAVEASRQRVASTLPERHQVSTSDQASLFASHPPAGLRRRMIASRPWRDPAVALTDQEWLQIDAELAPLLTRSRKTIAALG